MDPYDFIIEKVQKAGELLLHLRAEKFSVEIKNNDPRDIVTSVDKAVNEFLVSEIKKAFPTHGIYSEEGGGVESQGESRWIIDPIDGSANFSRGIPHFAICLGLPVVASAVYNPITKELFSSKVGKGAFLNGVPIHVSALTDLSKAHVFLHAGRKPEMWEWGGEAYKKLLAHAHKTKNFSGSALDICFVAAGRIEANIYGTLTNTLDLSPSLEILKEAGGVSSDEKGIPLSPGMNAGRVYTANNSIMLEAVRTLLES
jgi:fructose-1,6-bisphosphatase/inositol monophosphatase family enzyme